MSDILAGQPADAEALAEIYDLEHEQVSEDRVFYRELARRARGAVLDLGCGSGRLFRAFLDGGAREVVGIDGSAALVRRAEARISASAVLSAARDEGRLRVETADAVGYQPERRFALAVAAGLLPHLAGPEEADRLFRRASGWLTPAGRLVVDLLGPGAIPTRDLPLSVDWERVLPDGRRVVRRSRLEQQRAPEGTWVRFSTLVDVEDPDGTIARLPASFRLWYPSPGTLIRLVEGAGLVVETTYGTHHLEPLEAASEHCILVGRRPAREDRVEQTTVAGR